MSKHDRSCDLRAAQLLAGELTAERQAFSLPEPALPRAGVIDHAAAPVAGFGNTYRDQAWRTFLDWTREVTSSRIVYLCDRDGLVIEESGEVEETDLETSSMIVAALELCERRAGPDRIADLITVRIGTVCWTATADRETRLVLLFAGPQRPDETVIGLVERSLGETLEAERHTINKGETVSDGG